MRNMKVLCVVLLLGVTEVTAYVQPPPNLGDVRIKNPTCTVDGSNKKTITGEAQVFLTDGSSTPRWSSMCSNDFLTEEARTFCQQLGYEDGKANTPTTPQDDPVWIADVNCHLKSYSHIFHCQRTYKANQKSCPGQGQQQTVVQVECSGFVETYQYEGQVRLCPPDSENDEQSCPSQSVSTGIVSLNFDSNWGALSYNSSGDVILAEAITLYRGNLICQQMGFQQVVPGSVQTLSSYKQANYSFDHCLDSGDPGIDLVHTWVTTTDLYCESAVYVDTKCTSTEDDPCFSCCYNYPSKTSNLLVDNYIVIQCMYDAYNENSVPYGDANKCQYDTNGKNFEGKPMKNYNTYCARGSHKVNPAVVLGAFFGVTFVLLIVAVVAIIVIILNKYYERREYQSINTDKPNGKD